MRDRMARFALKLLTSQAQGYPRIYGVPYVVAVARVDSAGKITHMTSMGDVFTSTYGNPPGPPAVFSGYMGPGQRLSLLVALQNNEPGALEALTYMQTVVTGDMTVLQDMRQRAGWAIKGPGSESGTPRSLPPTAPSGVRIVK